MWSRNAFLLGDSNLERASAAEAREEHSGRSVDRTPSSSSTRGRSRSSNGPVCKGSVVTKWTPVPVSSRVPPHSLRATPFSPDDLSSTMLAKSERPKGRDNTLSLLNLAIEASNVTKEVLSITPAKAVCGFVSVILTMIRVGFLPLREVDWLWAETHPGFDDQQGGLRRAWAGLR